MIFPVVPSNLAIALSVEDAAPVVLEFNCVWAFDVNEFIYNDSASETLKSLPYDPPNMFPGVCTEDGVMFPNPITGVEVPVATVTPFVPVTEVTVPVAAIASNTPLESTKFVLPLVGAVSTVLTETVPLPFACKTPFKVPAPPLFDGTTLL